MRTVDHCRWVHHMRVLVLVGIVGAALWGCKSTPPSPLAEAISRWDKGAVPRLLDAGADVNARDASGYTPLHWAAYMGQADTTKLLLERGANMEALDNSKMTPLMVAVSCGQYEATQVLLEKGANVFARCPNGMAVVDFANNNRNRYGVSSPIFYMVIDRVEHCPTAQINDPAANGYTPLHWTASTGHVDAAKDLLQRGANLEALESGKQTPLLVAASNSQVDVARLLLEKGANANATDGIGWTSLHYAAYSNNADLVKLLLEHGADVQMKAKGETPLKIARVYQATEVVELLKAHGARE